jgi:hypothetical protein
MNIVPNSPNPLSITGSVVVNNALPIGVLTHLESLGDTVEIIDNSIFKYNEAVVAAAV